MTAPTPRSNLLARHELHTVPDYFALQSFRVLAERRVNARGQLIALSEATVKLDVAGRRAMEVGEGNGPVNALDAALRKALIPVYPELADMRLVDFKVRILDSGRRHRRDHPGHDRERRCDGQALVDHRRVAQHRRCLLQRARTTPSPTSCSATERRSRRASRRLS